MDQKKLNDTFNKYAGKEIPAHATPENSVIAALEADAKDIGLSRVRIWYPGDFGTMDYKPDRLNVYAEKGSDGKFYLENKFQIG